METSIGSMSNAGGAVMLCAMFIIVFVCVQKAVQEMSFFGDAAGWVVAFCVAMLSIIGLARFLGFPEPAVSPERGTRGAGGLLDVATLPYVALALTILVVLLLLAVGKVLHGREPRHRRKPAGNVRTTVKPHVERDRKVRRETRAPEPTEGRLITVSKNTTIRKRAERTRFDS